MTNDKYHETVMVREAIKALKVVARSHTRALYIDATLGTGGHSVEIVKAGGSLLGIDMDPTMIEIAKERIELACPVLNREIQDTPKFVQGNFRNIESIAKRAGFNQVDGILFDLGVSNLQLTSTDRGFSFSNENAPLDMRTDPSSQGLTAADLLNALREDQLKTLFLKVMRWGEAVNLAKEVVEARSWKKFETVGDFLSVCQNIPGKKGLNPATLPFLALRIAVNSELENLSEVLPEAFSLLKSGGRLVVMVFHSGEREIVMNFIKNKVKTGDAWEISKKPLIAEGDELNTNPRARSAEMYVLEKI